jgi:two-component system, chemotaxis family, protein-glutamate methylesterase/glutaminase
MIRVLLIDDSPIVLHTLQRLLSRSPEIQVVGTAANGKEGLDLIPALNPDVISTDLHMPVMNGLEFTREVMAKYPRPILVISVSVEADSPNVFKLLEAGAVDVFTKPRAIQDTHSDELADELARRIRILAGVKVFRRRNGAKYSEAAPSVVLRRSPSPSRIVVIGASTGGPQALRDILSRLPASFPLPIVCVQHIGSTFLSGMVAWLAEVCRLPVRKASHGEIPQPGIIYFAPEDAHLEFDGNGCFKLSTEPPVGGHRPSVSVTMRAAARCFGGDTVGILLTGMGRDGADGMASIAAAGGITLAQDEASSVVYGMPREAVALGAVQYLLPLDQIVPTLDELVNNGGIASVNRKGSSSYDR